MDVQPPAIDPLAGHHKYRTNKYLKSRSDGFVLLAVDLTTGEEVAVKFMERGPGKITKNVEREILNHSSLVHPHVIRFREAFTTDSYLAIAMEYARGGDMHEYVKNRNGLSEDDARWFYQQLVLGLDYCHKKNISNRDIKVENTLLDSDEAHRGPLLKICDFGYSINENRSDAKSRVGTPQYVAPEVLRQGGIYDGKLADVWSSGVLLYVMLFVQYPFQQPFDRFLPPRTQFQNVAQRILDAKYKPPECKPISPQCKDLLSKIFVREPANRITIAGICNHPWFREGMPPDLDVDNYNSGYVTLTAGEQHMDDIRAVLQVAASIGGNDLVFQDEDLEEI